MPKRTWSCTLRVTFCWLGLLSSPGMQHIVKQWTLHLYQHFSKCAPRRGSLRFLQGLHVYSIISCYLLGASQLNACAVEFTKTLNLHWVFMRLCRGTQRWKRCTPVSQHLSSTVLPHMVPLFEIPLDVTGDVTGVSSPVSSGLGGQKKFHKTILPARGKSGFVSKDLLCHPSCCGFLDPPWVVPLATLHVPLSLCLIIPLPVYQLSAKVFSFWCVFL